MPRRHIAQVICLVFLLALTSTPWSPSIATAAENMADLPELAELAETAGPAVVNISTETTISPKEEMRDFFKFHPRGEQFEDFFDQFDKFFDAPDSERKQQSTGSGFIISADGLIVTNNHVVGDADKVMVNLKGHGKKHESYKAEVIGRDEETDLALIKIEVQGDLPFLEFGDSEHLRVGNWVMAIGNPFGLDHTVTAGIVSAKSRIIGSGPYDDFIQTDASINPGNSGGPLIDLNGQVVGINTAIIASGQGIGFAIPSSLAKRIITQLKENKKVTRGWLGVSIQDVDENTAKALGLDEPKGALVSQTFPGNPAEQAGVKVGDVILAIGDTQVKDSNELPRAIAAVLPGDKTEITVWRKGKEKTLHVTMAERDAETLAQARGDMPEEEAPEQEKSAELGLTLRPVVENDLEVLEMDKAEGLLVIEISPASKADEGGIQLGDVILEANQEEINTVDTFNSLIAKAQKDKGVVMLLIKRQGRTLFRTIPLD